MFNFAKFRSYLKTFTDEMNVCKHPDRLELAFKSGWGNHQTRCFLFHADKNSTDAILKSIKETRYKNPYAGIVVCIDDEDEETQINLFRAGADDIKVWKTHKQSDIYNVQERALLERMKIKALAAAKQQNKPQEKIELSYKGVPLSLCFLEQTLNYNNVSFTPTPKPFAIMSLLFSGAGRIVPSEKIAEHLSGINFSGDYVRHAMKRVKEDFNKAGIPKGIIVTQRGVGYMLNANPMFS